jgi:hypothetical protein
LRVAAAATKGDGSGSRYQPDAMCLCAPQKASRALCRPHNRRSSASFTRQLQTNLAAQKVAGIFILAESICTRGMCVCTHNVRQWLQWKHLFALNQTFVIESEYKYKNISHLRLSNKFVILKTKSLFKAIKVYMDV